MADINQLDTWATEICNKYLKVKISEQVYIVTKIEFGEKEGSNLFIFKVLYGSHSSGSRWHGKYVDNLRNVGFTLFKVELDLWMREADSIWEYILVYLYDLVFVLRDPKLFIQLLEKISRIT